MSWQLVAIWAIVSGAIIWFVRDERVMRRVRQNGRLQRFGSTPVAVARRTPAPSTFRNDSAEAVAARQSFVEAMRNSKG